MVDLAAGTGKLTRLLSERGLRVVAVEPIDEMRRLLEERVPGVDARAGTAESMPLADGAARVVTVAQAFHWFDATRALPEIARVLERDGALVIVGNARDRTDPLQAALDEVIRPYRARYPNHRWDEKLGATESFHPPQEATFANEQLLDRAAVVERVASISWIAALPDGTRRHVLDEIHALVADREEPIRLPYTTEVFVCRRR